MYFDLVVECSPMVRETGIQSQVDSYQRLKKWYLMPPCLTFNIIRYGSRVKWSNPGNGVTPSPSPRCRSYWKGSLWVTLDYGRQFSVYLPKSFQRSRTLHKVNFKRNLTGLIAQSAGAVEYTDCTSTEW